MSEQTAKVLLLIQAQNDQAKKVIQDSINEIKKLSNNDLNSTIKISEKKAIEEGTLARKQAIQAEKVLKKQAIEAEKMLKKQALEQERLEKKRLLDEEKMLKKQVLEQERILRRQSIDAEKLARKQVSDAEKLFKKQEIEDAKLARQVILALEKTALEQKKAFAKKITDEITQEQIRGIERAKQAQKQSNTEIQQHSKGIFDSLGHSLSSFANHIGFQILRNGIHSLILPLEQFGEKAFEEFLKFEDGIQEVKGIIGDGIPDVRKFTEELVDMSFELGQNVARDAEFIKRVLTSGIIKDKDIEEIKKELGKPLMGVQEAKLEAAKEIYDRAAKFALASKVPIEDVLNAVITAKANFKIPLSDLDALLNKFKVMGTETKFTLKEVTGQLGALASEAKATGSSLEESLSLFLAVGNNLENPAVTKTAVVNLMRKITKPTGPSRKYIADLNDQLAEKGMTDLQLDFSVKGLREAGGWEGQLEKIKKVVMSFKEIQREDVAGKLISDQRAGKGLIQILSNLDKFKEGYHKILNDTDTFKHLYEARIKSLETRWKVFTDSLTTTFIGFYAENTDLLKEWLESFKDAVNEFIGYADNLEKKLQWLGDKKSPGVKTLHFLIKLIEDSVTSFITGLGDSINAVVDFAHIINSLIDGIQLGINDLEKLFGNFFRSLSTNNWDLAKKSWDEFFAHLYDRAKKIKPVLKSLANEVTRTTIGAEFFDEEKTDSKDKYAKTKPSGGIKVGAKGQKTYADPFAGSLNAIGGVVGESLDLGSLADEQSKIVDKFNNDLLKANQVYQKAKFGEYAYNTQKIKDEYKKDFDNATEALKEKQISEKEYKDAIYKFQITRDAQLSEEWKKELQRREDTSKKANDKYIKDINDKYSKELKIHEAEINLIEYRADTENMLTTAKLGLINKELKAEENLYREKASKFQKGTKEYEDSIEKATELQRKRGKNEKEIQKESLKNKIDGIKEIHDYSTSTIDFRAKFEKKTEYQILNDKIYSNKQYQKDIINLLANEEIVGEQRKQLEQDYSKTVTQIALDRLKQQEINEELQDENLKYHLEIREKIEEDQLKAKEEKTKQLKAIEEEELITFLDNKKTDIYQKIAQKKAELMSYILEIQGFNDNLPFVMDEDKAVFEKVQRELNDLKEQARQNELDNDKDFLDSKLNLYNTFANSLKNLGESLLKTDSGFGKSLGSLFTSAGSSFNQASSLYNTLNQNNLKIKDIENSVTEDTSDKEIENKAKQIESINNTTMAGTIQASMSIIEKSMDSAISTFGKYEKTLNKTSQSYKLFGKNSKEFAESQKDANELISDSFAQIPGIGDFLSTTIRNFTDAINVTRSDLQKQKDKNLLESTRELSKSKLQIEEQTIEKQLQIENINYEASLQILKEKGLDYESFINEKEVLEIQHQEKMNDIQREYAKKYYQIQYDLRTSELSLIDSYSNKKEQIEIDYWKDINDILTTKGLTDEELTSRFKIVENKKNKALNDLNLENNKESLKLESDYQKSKLDLGQDSLNKTLKLLELEHNTKMSNLNEELKAKKISNDEYNKLVQTETNEYQKKTQDAVKEHNEKIQSFNEQSYNAELSIIDKLYGEKVKRLQSEVDKEIEIIENKNDRLKEIEDNRNTDQELKQKRLDSFKQAISNNPQNAAFYRRNPLDFEGGVDANGKLIGNESQRKQAQEDYDNGLIDYATYAEKRSKIGLEKYLYYKQKEDQAKDPALQQEYHDKAQQGQQEYYEFIFDKEKEKVEIETKQAEKRLEIKRKELETATNLEKAEIAKLDLAYKDSAGNFKTTFVNATRDWIGFAKEQMGTLITQDILVSVNKAITDLNKIKNEASKIIDTSKSPLTGSSSNSNQTSINPNFSSTSYNLGEKKPGENIDDYVKRIKVQDALAESKKIMNMSTKSTSSGNDLSGWLANQSKNLISLSDQQKKEALINALVQNSPTYGTQYFWDKYGGMSVEQLKETVRQRGADYLIPNFNLLGNGGPSRQGFLNIIGETGPEYGVPQEMMNDIYNYVRDTVRINRINNNYSNNQSVNNYYMQNTFHGVDMTSQERISKAFDDKLEKFAAKMSNKK